MSVSETKVFNRSLTDVKNKYWLTILVTVGVFAAFFVFVFIYAGKLQKDTCKRTIESSLTFGTNPDQIKIDTPLDSEWKMLNSTERKQLLSFIGNRKDKYTECSDYSYLIEGEEPDGTELLIYARKNSSNRIEFKLDK